MSEEIPSPIQLFDIWIDYSEYRDMHRHEFHEFFLTLDGVGEQFTPEGLLRMKKRDLFFFPAGIPHNGNGSRDGNCFGGVINIHEKRFLEDSSNFPESRRTFGALTKQARSGDYKINISPAGRQQLFKIFSRMLEEVRVKKAGYKSLVNAMMHQFLITIFRYSQLDIPVKQGTVPVTVEKIKDTVHFLNNHFAEPIDIDTAAQMSNMSRSYFHANFREVTGKTLVEYLHELRVQQAEKLLLDTDLDPGTVAFRSGFSSVSHFYKVFKEVAGTSPGKIRTGKKRR